MSGRVGRVGSKDGQYATDPLYGWTRREAQNDSPDLFTPVRDAVSEALADGASRLALCDALRDLADELDDVTLVPIEHGGTRVIVRGDVSMIYGDEVRGVSAFPTPRRVRTVFPTRDEAVRSLVRLAAARRGATA